MLCQIRDELRREDAKDPNVIFFIFRNVLFMQSMEKKAFWCYCLWTLLGLVLSTFLGGGSKSLDCSQLRY